MQIKGKEKTFEDAGVPIEKTKGLMAHTSLL
jgi:hypothetical protein